MKTYKMTYPGDPPVPVVEMSRADFLAAFPRTPIVMSNPFTGKVYETIPLGADEIHCDYCNDDPGDTVYVVGGSRGYCAACFASNLRPHCVELPPRVG